MGFHILPDGRVVFVEEPETDSQPWRLDKELADKLAAAIGPYTSQIAGMDYVRPGNADDEITTAYWIVARLEEILHNLNLTIVPLP